METETTLVRAEGGVELDAVATVHLEVAIVVFPDNSELDDTLGDGSDLEGGAVLGVLLKERAVLEGARKLVVGLLELRLGRKVRHGGGCWRVVGCPEQVGFQADPGCLFLGSKLACRVKECGRWEVGDGRGT